MSFCAKISPDAMLVGMFVEAGKMSGDGGMEAADKVVEYLFIVAKLVEGVLEAILFVDELPDGPSVVVGEALDVGIDVEVLSLVVGLVLHMPNPPLRCFSLVAPQVLSL